MAIELATGRELGLIRLYDGNQIRALRKPRKHTAGLTPDGMIEYPPRIHATTVKNALRCRRYVLWSDVLGLRRIGYSPSCLRIGTVFHQVVSDLMKGYRMNDVLSRASKSFETFRLQIQAEAGRMAHMGNAGGALSSVNSMVTRAMLDFHKGVTMGVLFANKWPPNPRRYEVVDSEVQVVGRVLDRSLRGSEEAMKFPIVRIPIVGTIDLVLRDRQTGEFLLVDFKTTSSKPWNIVSAMEWDVQSVVYRLLAMARYPDAKIKGFYFIVMQKPAIELCGKDRRSRIVEGPKGGQKVEYYGDPDPELYLKRVAEWYEERQKTGVPEDDPILMSEHVFKSSVPQSDVGQLIRDTATLVSRRIRTDTWHTDFPRCGNYSTCSGWFGHSSPCPYLTLCQHGNRTDLIRLEIDRGFRQAHRDEILADSSGEPEE